MNEAEDQQSDPIDVVFMKIDIAFKKMSRYHGGLTTKALKATRLVDLIEANWSDEDKAQALYKLIIQLIDDESGVEDSSRLALKAAFNLTSGGLLGKEYEDQVAQWGDSDNLHSGLHERLFDFRVALERKYPDKYACGGDREAILRRALQIWHRGRRWLASTLKWEVESRNRAKTWQKALDASSSLDATPAHAIEPQHSKQPPGHASTEMYRSTTQYLSHLANDSRWHAFGPPRMRSLAKLSCNELGVGWLSGENASECLQEVLDSVAAKARQNVMVALRHGNK